MKLIVISSPDRFSNEVRLLNRLFAEGMPQFHLRKPGLTLGEVESLLTGIAPVHRSKIVVHDHFELAGKMGLGGIHFTNRTKTEIDKWRYSPGSKSISCHHLDELKNLPNGIDYAFLSPIFPSISKVGYSGDFDLNEVAAFLREFKTCQIIALGGIRKENIAVCRDTGFDGVAILGSIWDEKRPETEVCRQFLKMKTTCQQCALL